MLVDRRVTTIKKNEAKGFSGFLVGPYHEGVPLLGVPGITQGSTWWQTRKNFKVGSLRDESGGLWLRITQFDTTNSFKSYPFVFQKKWPQPPANHHPHTPSPSPNKRRKNVPPKKNNEASRLAAGLPIPRWPVGPTTNSKSSYNPSPAWPHITGWVGVFTSSRERMTFGGDGRSGSPTGRVIFLVCVELRGFLKQKPIEGLTWSVRHSGLGFWRNPYFMVLLSSVCWAVPSSILTCCHGEIHRFFPGNDHQNGRIF